MRGTCGSLGAFAEVRECFALNRKCSPEARSGLGNIAAEHTHTNAQQRRSACVIQDIIPRGFAFVRACVLLCRDDAALCTLRRIYAGMVFDLENETCAQHEGAFTRALMFCLVSPKWRVVCTVRTMLCVASLAPLQNGIVQLDSLRS